MIPFFTENCSLEGRLRLIGGQDEREGTVELCVDEAWGSVCDHFWGPSDASVVCRQMGYSPDGKYVVNEVNQINFESW